MQKMEHRADCHHRVFLTVLINFAIAANLIQTVYFDTWSRTINGIKKLSLLDHINVNKHVYVFLFVGAFIVNSLGHMEPVEEWTLEI